MASQRIQVSREAAQAAAEWIICLSAEDASPQDQAACARWRADSAEHEEAWQRALMIQKKLGLIPKELSLATLGRKQRVSRRQLINSVASLIVAAPTAYLGYRYLPWQGFTTEYSTRIGQRKAFTLADGTELHLNTDTWAAVAFDEQQRQIRLHHGEVFIRTGGDPQQRPLVVITESGQLSPLGTAFNVRHLRDTEITQLRVVEGAVAIRAGERDLRQVVNAGERTKFSALAIEQPVVDRQSGVDWVQGVLQAENMSLAELVTELSRYRHGWLRCDPAVAQLRVSGAFQLRDTNQILHSLKHSLPVQVVYRTDYWVTIMPAR